MSWTLKAYTTQPLLCSTKYVRKLPERLKIIEENNPTDRRSNVAKRHGLAPSALNAIVARRREIREQIGESCKKRKSGGESTSRTPKCVLFRQYQAAGTSGFLIVDSTERNKARKIAGELQVDNFAASNDGSAGCNIAMSWSTKSYMENCRFVLKTFYIHILKVYSYLFFCDPMWKMDNSFLLFFHVSDIHCLPQL